MSKRKKLLFAAVDIGWRIEHYTKYIHQNFEDKLEVESFVKYKLPKEHYRTNYTYVIQYHKYPKIIQWMISFLFFCYALFKYDIFHFFSAETLLTRKLMRFELAIYKLFGKRVIMHFVGSDIRNPEVLYWRDKNINLFFEGQLAKQPPMQQKWQKTICRIAECYADKIIVSTPDLISFFSKRKPIYLPVFIDYDRFIKDLGEFDKKTNDKIIILHAPSNPTLKGSPHINHWLKQLKEKYPNKFEIILTSENKLEMDGYTVTRYELLELYKRSHIVIDQILIGWYGLQSVESLLSKSIPFCYISPKYKNYLFPNSPIIQLEFSSFEEKILKIAKKIQKNKIDWNKINNWVLQHHSINNYYKEFKEIWLE